MRILGDRKARAFGHVRDEFAGYWNDLMNMKLRALDHMESSGYDPELNYAQCREEYESAKQHNKNVSVLYIDDRTQGMLFADHNVTLDQRFQLVTAHGNIVGLSEITEKTVVFCPKHEINGERKHIGRRRS